MLGKVSLILLKPVRVPINGFMRRAPVVPRFILNQHFKRSYSNLLSRPNAQKPVWNPSKPHIQKRFHAECGQAPAGENPGVGMERELRKHLRITNLIVEDTSGNGSFWYLEVVSPDFEGKTPVACQKLVYSIIDNQMKEIHGIRLKTKAPPKV